MMLTPSIMKIAAPSDAPDATPVVYGSARGLRMMDCIMAPPTASPAPAKSASRARGTVYSHTMRS